MVLVGAMAAGPGCSGDDGGTNPLPDPDPVPTPLARSLVPIPLDSELGFDRIYAGFEHTCGITPEGSAFCWGDNEFGELGTDAELFTCAFRFPCTGTPQPVAGDLRFSSLLPSARSTCGLTLDGAAYCWGYGIGGELGGGRENITHEPTAVTGGHTFLLLTGRFSANTCGLTTGREILCWGPSFGSTPTPFSSPVAFAEVSRGRTHSCGLDEEGVAHCWGGNAAGALGQGSAAEDGGIPSSSVPLAVVGEVDFREISVGSAHSCALTGAGTAWCWGKVPQVGNGDTAVPWLAQPTPVREAGPFRSLDAGFTHTCGVTESGQTLCWGENFGNLGDGTEMLRASPSPVSGDLSFRAVSSGAFHTCGLTEAGRVYCWGVNPWGQLGRDPGEITG